uniref:Uncharacterized protein n=1 Tax=Anopheles melas TaxID=34690 RepID=A0A182TNC5_9DIPT
MILEDTIKFRKCAKTPEDVAKWRLTYNFIIETKYFLERYDSIVETWDLCDKQFMMNLWSIEELLTNLLYKYTTVSTDYIRHPRLPKVEIKCCDMKAGLLKLELYRNSLKYYLEFGTWCDHVLCLYLKKIYRKVNVTMDPFREAPLVVPGKEPTPPPEQESEVEEDEV